MAVLKFRVAIEEDDAIYRDIIIKHTQTFRELHDAILRAYEFDNKHQATFYRSNDNWQRGREISLDVYDKSYRVEPLIMDATTIGSEIKDTSQKFIYEYDFAKHWTFLVELINVNKEEDRKATYPSTARVEGIGPQQYGAKSILGDKYNDIEEKYDISEAKEGFGDEGEENLDSDTENFGEENTSDEEY